MKKLIKHKMKKLKNITMTNCYFIPLFDTYFKLPTSAKECDPSYIKLFI